MQKQQLCTLLVPLLWHSIATASVVRSETVAFPSKEQVTVCKTKIARDLRIGSLIRYGTIGTAMACLSYFFWDALLKDSKVASSSSDILTNEQLSKKLVALEKKCLKKPKLRFFSMAWLKGVGKSAFTSSLSTGLGYLVWGCVKKIYDTYNCFDNLRLFIKKRLPSVNSCSNVMYAAETLDYAYENEDAHLLPNQNRFKNRFIVAFKNVVSEVEAIIAFMEYKIELYLAKGIVITQEELLFPNTLFDYTWHVCRAVEQEISHYSGDGALYLIIKDYISYLDSTIKIFSYFESRTSWAGS